MLYLISIIVFFSGFIIIYDVNFSMISSFFLLLMSLYFYKRKIGVKINYVIVGSLCMFIISLYLKINQIDWYFYYILKAITFLLFFRSFLNILNKSYYNKLLNVLATMSVMHSVLMIILYQLNFIPTQLLSRLIMIIGILITILEIIIIKRYKFIQDN